MILSCILEIRLLGFQIIIMVFISLNGIRSFRNSAEGKKGI